MRANPDVLTHKLSAFADELGPNPVLQYSTLRRLGIDEIQLRGAWGKNVMDMSVDELRDLKSIADDHNLAFHAIGSPLGKVNIAENPRISIEKVNHASEVARIVGARRVRVFSFYRNPIEEAVDVRTQVIDRLGAMLEAAKEGGVSLVHENEKDIFGDTGSRCSDLADELPELELCFDFANFVQCGEDVLACWELLRDRVVYFDVKDAVALTKQVVPAGSGDGQVAEIIRDALRRGFDDRFNLEPHLSSGGQFGGETSPELFEIAVNALRAVLGSAGSATD